MSEQRKPFAETVPATEPADAEGGASPAPHIGARFRVGQELGRGGMGRVVEAYDVQLGRTVALKQVLPGAGQDVIVRRFKREVQITARLEHASIVPLYDSGIADDGLPYYVMRRVSGRPLDQLIASAAALSGRLALLPNLLAAIDAIAHAHRRGVIHRDLKPSNILVGDLGETVVIDWGLAKVIGEEDEAGGARSPSAGDSLRTQVGSVFGTPGFMAPEQARGDELDARGDVYALGATLYHLLAGHPPIKGNSATEVIADTQRAAIKPITETCPGAPAELVAILEKALAYEPAARYRDAGALGEDVRRFLTGQLVAAHRYTVAARLVRLVRRHRGSFAIGLAAVAALALFGVWSIRRIVTERDAATAARQEAEDRRRAAEVALADARAKADELKLTSARGFADTDPIKAIALLKTLRADSPKLGAAFAIAKHAVVRGVPWGLPSVPGIIIDFEMSSDGSQIVQVNRFGELQVLDLRSRSVGLHAKIDPNSHATWVAGDKLFIRPQHGTPQLMDARGGTTQDLAMPEVGDCAVTASGDAVACAYTRGVGVLEVATRTWHELWAGTGAKDLEISDDGTWLAFGQRVDRQDRLIVIGRDGHELLRREGEARLLAHSRGGQLAVLGDDGVYIVRPAAAKPVFVRAAFDADTFRYAHWLTFLDENVGVFSGYKLWDWKEGTAKALQRGDYHTAPTYGREAGDGFLVAGTTDDKIEIVSADVQFALTTPSVPSSMVRIAARRGVTTFATTGKDVVLLWDLATCAPRSIPDIGNLAFLDETHALVDQEALEWDWVDLVSGERTRIEIPGLGGLGRAQSDGLRMLVVRLFGAQNRFPVGLLQPGQLFVPLANVPGGVSTLVEGGAVVFAGEHGEVLGKVGGGPVHVLTRLQDEIISVTSAGYLRFAALDARGNLVRGQIDGPVEHVHVAAAPQMVAVGTKEGSVWIAADNRLLLWTTDVHEVFAFPPRTAIDELTLVEAGVVVFLSSSEGYFLPKGTLALPVRLPLGSTNRATATRNNQIVGLGVGHALHVIDLPSVSPWSLPGVAAANQVFYASPGGTRIAQRISRGIVLWTMPQPTGDLATWLDDVTNVTIDGNGVLVWPWQGVPVVSSGP